MYEMYVAAANAANTLAYSADVLASKVNNEFDKQICENHSVMAKRFAAKALRAADKTLTMLNDGTLKEYCKEFDKVFEQFVTNAAIAELELAAIAKKSDG